MTNTNDATGWYANTFKAWQVKQLGPKPSADLLKTAHYFGRPGKQSLALAMAMRPDGVTAGQIQIACGAPQNNHRRGLIEAGMFKREAVAPNELGHTVYKVTLTAKGAAAVKRRDAGKADAATDAAPKAKGKAKGAAPAKVAAKPKAPRKPKVLKVAPSEAPATEPVTEQAPVNEPATEQATA